MAFGEQYRLYESKRPPRISWSRAARAIASGEQTIDLFTLPWWDSGTVQARWIYGAHHNEDRAQRLMDASPDGVDPFGDPWYVGLLYQGMSDQYVQNMVGIVTREGHVGCVWPSLSSGGLYDFVGRLAAMGKHFLVPLAREGDELRLLVPHSDGVNFFDWTEGVTVDGRDAWRLNLSKVLAMYLARYGYCEEWLAAASELNKLKGFGVAELEPLRIADGFVVAMDEWSIEEREFVDRFCRRLGLSLQFNLDGLPNVLLSRSRKNPGGLMVREAVRRGIAIYRADVFMGMVAEGLVQEVGF